MYECPNCAGNLQFDIGCQQLLCRHCNTTVDPYSFNKEKDAEETTEYQVTAFTCPQCGGEILSEDTTAATFCSFCGAATILDSRISKERRPARIIPFTKTKEDCKKAYMKMMRRAVFAPKELKKAEHIENFRGIYMPYWIYSFENKGEISFNGSRSHRRGDYLNTKYYTLQSQLDASYQGISYDASAAFSDNLSSAIAPFDLTQEKPFTPSFLSGFYADTSDVDNWVYQGEAQDMVLEDGFRYMSKNIVCKWYHVADKNEYSLKNALRPGCTAQDLVMLPVWFLSYQNGDRVAYAVVNGQTGKAAADLPVDRKKYIIGSMLLALPIFFLLNLSFTVKPNILLWLSILLAFICGIISSVQMSRIRRKESGEDDRGLIYKRSKANGRMYYPDEGYRKKRTGGPVGGILFTIFATILVSMILPLFLLAELARGGGGMVTGIIALLLFTGILMRPKIQNLGLSLKDIFSGLAKPAAVILFSLLILFIHPVSDLYYYGGAIAALCVVIWNLMDIIGRYNVLTTRKLPQFNRRGGDNIA